MEPTTDLKKEEKEKLQENEKKKKKDKNYFFINPGKITMEAGVEGIKFDFNYGVRVYVPKGNFRVRFIDLDTSTILYDAKASDAFITSTKKYYIRFRLEVYKNEKLVFSHDHDLKGKNVLIRFPVGTIGDIMAWFPYARYFKEKHGCNLYCSMDKKLSTLFEPEYKEIKFLPPNDMPEDCYASYYMGIFFPADDRNHQPADFRIVGLQKNIPYILGLDVIERRPILTPKKEREIKDPYVCIAVQATSQAKCWNNPSGWIEVVSYLKNLGYRVLCIDKEKVHGGGRFWNTIPYGAEDFTGDRPLQERVDLLGHADFFIGLSSGLSWIAWGSGTPVIMISGFTLPHNEFYTPYRVINFHVCTGCWTDSSEQFEHSNYTWCPRHENTERAFECTRFISSGQVISKIHQIMKEYQLDPKNKKMRGFMENHALQDVIKK